MLDHRWQSFSLNLLSEHRQHLTGNKTRDQSTAVNLTSTGTGQKCVIAAVPVTSGSQWTWARSRTWKDLRAARPCTVVCRLTPIWTIRWCSQQNLFFPAILTDILNCRYSVIQGNGEYVWPDWTLTPSPHGAEREDLKEGIVKNVAAKAERMTLSRSKVKIC